MAKPQIFNRNMKRLAYLDNAIAVGYALETNSLWSATFTLPADDPKNQYCTALNFVEIFDGDERIDLFRIIGEDLERSDGATRYYNCEHVLATLLSDVLFKYHQCGGSGVKTADVLNYVLARQTVQNWKLGACDFTRYFEYNWENSTLLAALFAVPECFDKEYLWSWDTTVYPWTLSLVVPADTLKSEVRYAKNMTTIKKTTDATSQQIYNFSDNADATHPAKLRLYISDSVVRINKMLLNIKFEAFRAYEKAVGGGGGQTTSSGGGQTTNSGGGSTTSSGGGQTTSAGGGATSSATPLVSSNTQHDASDDGGTGGANHNHSIERGTKLAITTDGKTVNGYVTWVPSGKHTHPAHTHTISAHTHTVSSHTHNVSAHTHTVAAHTHTVQNHTHELEFGIYEGQRASSATIKVDGNIVPAPERYSDIDIVAYLETDNSGKIRRNAWHTIEILPDNMSRVVGAVFAQTFCNSRGGGDY